MSVAALVLQGRSTRQIVSELHVSANTVASEAGLACRHRRASADDPDSG
jgi:hypothetical protein